MIYKRKFDRKTFEKYNKVLKNQESERFDESFGTETRKGHWNGSLSLEMAIELGKNHSTTVDFRLSCLMSSTRDLGGCISRGTRCVLESIIPNCPSMQLH